MKYSRFLTDRKLQIFQENSRERIDIRSGDSRES